MIKQTRYWKTRDLYIAAYCFAGNGIIVGIEATERKIVFAFLDTLELRDLRHQFRFGRPMVDARIYICALRILRQKGIDALMEQDGGNR